MATTIRQAEATPASYPAAPAGLSTAAAALDAATIWQRIEAYTAYRYSSRSIVWTVEGPGEWLPPLAPATIATVEQWSLGGFEAIILSASPSGGYCLHHGIYRFSGNVGAGPVPASVSEAFRRLAEFIAAATINAQPGVRQEKVDAIGETTYDAAALARAMERSGAGDLLRTFRRAA